MRSADSEPIRLWPKSSRRTPGGPSRRPTPIGAPSPDSTHCSRSSPPPGRAPSPDRMTIPRGVSVGGDEIHVLLVGTDDDFGTELEGEGFDVARIPDLASLGPGSDQDAVIVALDDPGPLEALETLRLKTPAAAILVLTTAEREADGAVALHAGAEDHLVHG